MFQIFLNKFYGKIVLFEDFNNKIHKGEIITKDGKSLFILSNNEFYNSKQIKKIIEIIK